MRKRPLFVPAVRRFGIAMISASATFALGAITVTNFADSGAGTLREAITNAASGETIGFAPATGAIQLAGPLPVIDKDLTIDPGSFGRIVIDGAGAHRILKIDSGTVVLRNLTLANGVGRGGHGGAPGGGGGLGAGGCLYAEGGTITLDGIRFIGCRAFGGSGGIDGRSTLSGGGGGGSAAGANGSPALVSTGGAGAAGFVPAENGGTGGNFGFLGAPGDPGGNGGFGAGGGAGGGSQSGAGSTGSDGGAGGNGGFGGGGGGGGPASGSGTPGAPGISLPSGYGGTGGTGASGTVPGATTGGGGAALGPAIFVHNAQVTLTNSGALGSLAIGGSGGGGSATAGTALADPLFAVTPSNVTGTLAAGIPGGLALAVTKAGSGNGTVTSSPAAVDCGTTCTATFETGTLVTLTASVAAGSTFGGWGGACNGTGTCLVTMDAAKGVTATFTPLSATPHLANIATRSLVLSGENVMIAGFIIQGEGPQTVYVRARGPSLVPFGVVNALPDPVLQLFSGQLVIASNDDWQASADAAAILASGFAPSDPREAVIRATLPPGAYTAIVTGKNGATGVGIIEVFAQ